jgi:RHS repeat-associated protein
VSKSLSSIAGWTAGATYRVTFKYTANPGGVIYPPAVKRMRVTTANASYEFVGAATDTLAFTSLDPAGNPCGIAPDAVVVERVSAPPPGAPHETVYAWNGFDKLTQVTMTRGAVTQTRSFSYDARMRLVSETHPETGTKSYGYDDLNRLTAKTDAKNQQVKSIYDNYHRVVRMERYPVANGAEDLAQRTTFTYDTGTGTNLMGRVSEIVYGDPASSPVKERFSYTVGGLVTSKTLVPGSYPSLTGQWTWDNEGKMLSGKYPDWNQDTGNPSLVVGEKFVYTYDAMGMPATMALDTGVGYVTSAAYNAAGQMTQMVRGAALGSTTERWQYDSRGLMTRETATSAKDLSYGYGADGKVTYKKDWLANAGSGEEYGYSYDALGRLTGAWTGSAAWGLAWDIDGFGNRYAQRVTKGSAPVVSFVVDQTKNRLIGTGWAYDANGNATSTPANPSLSYDIENRLTGYLYDAANRRLREGTVIYNYYGLGGELLGQYEAKKDTYGVRKWVRRVDNSLRVWFAGRLVKAGASYEQRYTDRLGSVVTPSGMAASYYPYGEEVAASTNDGREKYATYRRDATGLDYAWNRMYSSTYGRFLSADPYRASASMTNPQSWNRYAYVGNDPVNYHDPGGLFAINPCYGYSTANKVECAPPFSFLPGAPTAPEPSSPGAALVGGGGGAGSDPSDDPEPNKDPCDELRNNLDQLVNAVRGSNATDQKGLAQLYNQLRHMRGITLINHVSKFYQRRQELRKKINHFKDQNCGDPPTGVEEWANKEVPEEVTRYLHEIGLNSFELVLGVYATYRFVRLIPSLFPPLWITLPANLALP